MKNSNKLYKYASLSFILLVGLVSASIYAAGKDLTKNPKEALIDPFWIISGKSFDGEEINEYLQHNKVPI